MSGLRILIKYFLILKKKIHVASQPLEDIIIENYSSALRKYLGIFVKRANKDTLVETFEEDIEVEKYYLASECERTGKIDDFPRKRNEISSKSSSYNDSKAFDVEQLHNAIRALTNEVAPVEENFRNLFF